MVYGDSQLRWVLPGVREAFEKTRADALAVGIKIKVNDFGGARTPGIVSQLIEWRDKAVAQGEPSYRVSSFEKGKHGVGGAVDFSVTSHPVSMSEDAAYAKVAQLARPHGLVWGGTFSAPADIFHLESQQTRDQLQTRWNEWVKSPQFPRMGVAEYSILAALAIVALILILAYLRR